MAPIVGLALAIGGCAVTPQPTPVVTVPTVPALSPTPAFVPVTYTVRRGEVVDALSLRGRLAATLDQDVLAATSGYVSVLHVGRGDQVTQGQLLAELDIGDLPKQLEQAQVELRSLERPRNNVQRELMVDMARLQLQEAEDRLARLKAPPSLDDLAIASGNVVQARLTLENSRNALSATKTNAQIGVERAANALRNAQDAYSKATWANQGGSSSDDLGQLTRALTDAELGLQSAQLAYDLAVKDERNGVELGEQALKLAQQAYEQLLAPPDAFDLRAAERAVQEATISLKLATASAEDATSAARIEQLKVTIAELEAEVAKAKLYAPFDGLVAEIGAQIGDKVEVYDALMNVIDPTRFTMVIADINSDELARIAIGQPVEIAIERYPGEVIPGRVERLPSDQVAPASAVRADPLLRIAFDPGARALEVGDIAEATFTFKKAQDALWLPPVAVVELNQRTYVLVQDGAQKREVDVTVGVSTPERIQILSGLSEGDVVLGPSDVVAP